MKRATVFGLDVYPDAPVVLLGEPRAKATGRKLHLYVEPQATPWPSTAQVLCDERMPDGSVGFCIEMHPESGYLIWGPDYGRHVLSADGQELCCWTEGSAREQWQRLLIAQVLPFAALRQGLEVLHASAVVIDGQAVAFVGSSGSGKTSIALELCRLGAEFLADDVLALEIFNDELWAHPGTPVAGLDRDGNSHLSTPVVDLDRDGDTHLAMPGSARPATVPHDSETLLRNAHELLVAVPGAGAPVPLVALFFLDRRAGGPSQPCFEPVTDPRMLLSATFNFVLYTPERLRGLLEVCSLAAARRVERIGVDTGVDVTRLGEVVLERMSAARS